MPKHADLDQLLDGIQHGAPLEKNTGQPLPSERSGGKLPWTARLTLWFGGGTGKVTEGTICRRSFPITAYVGPNGGGKTLAMVVDTLPTLAGEVWVCDNPKHAHTQRGETTGVRRVLSTVPFFDPDESWDGDRWERPTHALYDPFTSFDQLLTAEHCDVIMDEVVNVASSREAARLDVRLQGILVQLRKRDVVLRWSAPNWARADKIIREVTQLVVECRGFYSDRRGVGGTVGLAMWAPKRVFKFSCFKMTEFEEWSAGKRDKLEPENSHWFRGVGSRAFASYDTLAAVEVVEQLTPDGVCPHCGLPQRREYCKGHHDSQAQSRRSPGFEPHEHPAFVEQLAPGSGRVSPEYVEQVASTRGRVSPHK